MNENQGKGKGQHAAKKLKVRRKSAPDKRRTMLAASTYLSLGLAAVIALFFAMDFRNHIQLGTENPPNFNAMADLLFIAVLPVAILFLIVQTYLLSQILTRLNQGADGAFPKSSSGRR